VLQEGAWRLERRLATGDCDLLVGCYWGRWSIAISPSAVVEHGYGRITITFPRRNALLLFSWGEETASLSGSLVNRRYIIG